MSWSFSAIGKPENVVAALNKRSEELHGESKAEFDEALPHLVGLLGQNFAAPGSAYTAPVIDFEASGSGSAKDGYPLSRNCSVSIRSFARTLV